MDKLKNKNTIVLIISAVLILIAIIVAVVATASSGKDKKEKDTTTTPQESISIDLGSIADLNNTPTTTEAQQQTSYSFTPGKYKIATKDDPLGLRLEPNTSSDRLVYIPKGETVEVIAVWEDWGYVVYEKTGGWLSMNYLELLSGKTQSSTTTTTTATSEQ